MSIPLDFGIDKAMSIDDYVTTGWVFRQGEENIIRFGPGRYDVREFPFGSGIRLKHPYSILFLPNIRTFDSRGM